MEQRLSLMIALLTCTGSANLHYGATMAAGFVGSVAGVIATSSYGMYKLNNMT